MHHESTAVGAAGYRAIEGVRGDLDTLRERFVEFRLLLGNLEGNEQHKSLNNAILGHTRTLARRIEEIGRQLRKTPYPVEHAREEIDLRQALIEKIPPRDNVGEVYQACESLFEKYVPAIHASDRTAGAGGRRGGIRLGPAAAGDPGKRRARRG